MKWMKWMKGAWKTFNDDNLMMDEMIIYQVNISLTEMTTVVCLDCLGNSLHPRWFKPWPFDPQTLEVTIHLWKGHKNHYSKKVTIAELPGIHHIYFHHISHHIVFSPWFSIFHKYIYIYIHLHFSWIKWPIFFSHQKFIIHRRQGAIGESQ